MTCGIFRKQFWKGRKMTNIQERDMLIQKWQLAADQLAVAKKAEAELRNAVLAAAFEFCPDALREGTENIELGLGYKLKSVFKISRTFVGGSDGVEAALSKIEKLGAEGQFIANRLVKWKPELSIAEYKSLPDKIRKLIDEVIVSKEAMPSLELVEPKAK
jgi:hypothetical protein